MYSDSWLIFCGVIFSWVIGTFSLRCHTDDSGLLHFDCVDDVCDLFLDVVVKHSLVILIDDFFVDLRFREPAPLPSKFPSVCRHLFPESTFDSDLSLSCCLLKSCRTW